MSGLARSVANSLRIDDDEEEEEEEEGDRHNDVDVDVDVNVNSSPKSPKSELKQLEEQPELEEEEGEDGFDDDGRGVKEDLSEFTETLTRQLWGVASFLAPAPQSESTQSVPDLDRRESSDQSGSGNVSDGESVDFVEASGDRDHFSEGLPNGMSHPMESNLENSIDLSVELEDQIEDAVGITDEVLTFASNIAHHPETWLDFPLSEDEDMDEFELSDAQIEHALAVEHLTPRLAALRFELCPAHMSEAYFWKVYFVLLHSRLDKHDAELLSTTQSITARKMWMQELHRLSNPEPDWFGRSTSYSKERTYLLHDDFEHPSSEDGVSGNKLLQTSAFETGGYSATETETDKQPVVSTEIQIIDKCVIEEEPVMKAEDKNIIPGPSYKLYVQNYDDDDDDDWVKENSDLDGYSAVFEGNDEDVSFSDLEEDADISRLTQFKIGSKASNTSTKTS